MATGLSTMSLMRVTNNLTTPYNSPIKDESSKSKSSHSSSSASKEAGSSKGSQRKLDMERVSSGKARSVGDRGASIRSKLDFELSKVRSGSGRIAGGQSSKMFWPPKKKGGLVLDLIVECEVETLWGLFTDNNETSTLWRRFFRHRKYDEVKMGSWTTLNEEKRVMERSNEYITGFKSSFIRGKHKTLETHTVTLAKEGIAYVLENKARVPTLPIGDCMYTVIQYCFAARNKKSAYLQASYEIVYTKKTTFKSVIEKSTAGGIKDSMKDLQATLATISKVRDASSVQALGKTDTSAQNSSMRFEAMVTHETFRFLMQYPHAILAFMCFLYLAAVRLNLVKTQDAMEPECGLNPAGLELPGDLEMSQEMCAPPDGTGSMVHQVPRGSTSTEFCTSALTFWLSGYIFKFLVLACHWVITNISILMLLLFKILKPVFALCSDVARSEMVKKMSEPVRKTVTAVWESLEIRKTHIDTSVQAPESESYSPGEVVPAAAEAAMVVSKIAKFSGLSPAAQVAAVKGLSDKRQAQLISNSTISDSGEESGLVIEEVFENQRYQPFRGWGSSWPGHLLPTDCGKWSDRIGLPKVGTKSQMFELVAPALPPNWVWLETEWQIDFADKKEARVDKDGFYYGVMAFSSLKDFPPPPDSGLKTMKHYVRRRRWLRTRIHTLKIREVLTKKDIEESLGKKIEALLGWRRQSPTPKSDTQRNEQNVVQNTDQVLEELFEQEERIGRHNEWIPPLSTKRWSNRDGTSSAEFSEVAPALPDQWKWVGHWNIDNSKNYSDRVDDDGWTYIKKLDNSSFDFPTGTRMQTMENKARRRRWIRHRRRIREDEALPVPVSPEVDSPSHHHNRAHSSSMLDVLDLSGTYKKEEEEDFYSPGETSERNLASEGESQMEAEAEEEVETEAPAAAKPEMEIATPASVAAEAEAEAEVEAEIELETELETEAKPEVEAEVQTVTEGLLAEVEAEAVEAVTAEAETIHEQRGIVEDRNIGEE
mmetsp:Transcript_5398/g.9742  ORF Transcript_5398/g.9742 Transcript_5398/m.9742 type:complete len:994 (-) Transcript_5398:50-3031(-)